MAVFIYKVKAPNDEIIQGNLSCRNKEECFSRVRNRYPEDYFILSVEEENSDYKVNPSTYNQEIEGDCFEKNYKPNKVLFVYKAEKWSGDSIQGEMECKDIEECIERINKKGYLPVSITKKDNKNPNEKIFSYIAGVNVGIDDDSKKTVQGEIEGENRNDCYRIISEFMGYSVITITEKKEESENIRKDSSILNKYVEGFDADIDSEGCGCLSFFCPLGVFFWLAGAEIGVYVFVIIGLMIFILAFNRLKTKKARKNILVYVWAPFSLCYVVYVLWCVVFWLLGEDTAYYGILVFKEIMVIVVMAVAALTIYLIDNKIRNTLKNKIQKRLDDELEDKNKKSDFEKAYPEVTKKYFSVIDCIQKRGGNLEVYKNIVKDIYLRSMDLHFKIKEIKDKANKYKTVVSELKKTLSLSSDEERNSISINNLQKAEAKLEKYEQYIQEVNNTINGTAQDFLNIEIELMNNDFKKSDDFNEIESSLNSLEAKSKSLAYIQSHFPVFD